MLRTISKLSGILFIYLTFIFVSYSEGSHGENEPFLETLSAGGQHTCLLTEDKRVHCWGSGKSGQLGHKVNMSSDRPVIATNELGNFSLGLVKQISTGAYHTCVLKDNGTARCWGYGGHGRLGYGSHLSSNTPVTVVNPSGNGVFRQLQQISAGDHHACVVRQNGNVYCWGLGEDGQLGHGHIENTPIPVVVVGTSGNGTLDGVTSVSAGTDHTCALQNHQVYCWGSGLSGQLGQSTGLSYPTAIYGSDGVLSEVKQIQSGNAYSCALKFSGEVLCWGNGSHGRLGHGNNVNLNSPTNVLNPDGLGALQHIEQISLGSSHACALQESGEALCWGMGLDGRLGNAQNHNSNLPVKVVSSNGKPINQINQINAGESHTCISREDRVQCWGNGEHGRLGNGDNQSSYTPVNIVEVSKKKAKHYHDPLIEKLSSGGEHTCVVRDNGEALCWGRGSYGRLGSGLSNQSAPTEVINLKPDLSLKDSQISAGNEHTCVVRNKQALCWGRGSYGRLGSGNFKDSSIPVAVVNANSLGELNDVKQIRTGDYHTCALGYNGEVLCWGYGGNGQLGQGNYTNTNTPQTVVDINGLGALSGIKQINLGGDHSCALKIDGRILCWGNGTDGQLGHGSNEKSNIPVEVRSKEGEVLMGFEQVSSGENHTCALKYNGEVLCWGKGSDGRLGNADSGNKSSNNPVQAIASGAEQVGVGKYHSCALMGNGKVYCWGRGNNGQLGNNSYRSSNIPKVVKGMNGKGVLSGITQISGGRFHTCALSQNSKIFCWGNGENGRLGNGSYQESKIPTLVVTRNSGTIPFKREKKNNNKKISVGDNYACAIKSNKQILCWGYRTLGQLGDGKNSKSRTPVVVVNANGSGPLTQMKQISSGPSHTCATKVRGGVLCWGSGQDGQLGHGEYEDSNIPVFVKNLDGIKDLRGTQQVSAGYEHACALKNNRTVLCWGRGSSGTLGNGTKETSSIPVRVVGTENKGLLNKIIQISAGDWHTCAVNNQGEVFCWGFGNYGILGNNKTKNSSFPVRVNTVGGMNKNVEQVNSGGSHSCALTYDGHVFCWGKGTYGQLGDGLNRGGSLRISAIPIAVVDVSGDKKLNNIEQISLGFEHSCAMKRSGQAFCWGGGTYGQLGDGHFTYVQTRPVAITNMKGNLALKNVKEIASGEAHSCTLQDNGKVLCWGSGEGGQLGNKNSGDVSTPQYVLDSTESNAPLDLN